MLATAETEMVERGGGSGTDREKWGKQHQQLNREGMEGE